MWLKPESSYNLFVDIHNDCRQSLLSLGPTFIKVGQLFSTRSDLFPAAFTEELAKLQDRVPAFAPAKAKAIIEAEFGAPVQQLFSSFQEQPIAAASLGQVDRPDADADASCVVTLYGDIAMQ